MLPQAGGEGLDPGPACARARGFEHGGPLSRLPKQHSVQKLSGFSQGPIAVIRQTCDTGSRLQGPDESQMGW